MVAPNVSACVSPAALDISTSGRSGRNGECHSATNNGDGNDGKLCSGQVLRASLHFGLRLLQDQLGLPARFQLMTSPSLLR